MKILHFGDIHFWKLGTDRDFLYPKRVLGSVNLAIRRRFKFPPDHALKVAEHIAKQDADLVLFSGDFTTMSLVPEYEMARKAFAPIVEKWRGELFAIPGNHDRYSPRSVRDKRLEEYLPFAAFPRGKKVKTHTPSDAFSVVGFDCSHPCRVRSNGTFTKEIASELRESLIAEKGAGREVLLMGHYPYAYGAGTAPKWEHKLLEEQRLIDLVAEFEPKIFFHGHKHIRWAFYPPETPKTLNINCGAAGMTSSDPLKQAGFLTLELDSSLSPTEITTHYLTESGFVTETLSD